MRARLLHLGYRAEVVYFVEKGWQVILICYNCTTTFIISVLTLSTLLTCYLKQYNTNASCLVTYLFWQIFQACCEGSWLLNQNAVSVCVVRSCMRKRNSTIQLESTCTKSYFSSFWSFWLLIAVSDLQRLYTWKIISNRPNSVPSLTHCHQSSW